MQLEEEFLDEKEDGETGNWSHLTHAALCAHEDAGEVCRASAIVKLFHKSTGKLARRNSAGKRNKDGYHYNVNK